MWMRASAQSTSAPFIQIFSVGVMGMSEPFCDAVADDRRRPRGYVLTSLADAGGGVGLTQVVEHERGRQDGGDRVGPAGAGDVRGRAVHGLEERGAGAGGVGVRRRRPAE